MAKRPEHIRRPRLSTALKPLFWDCRFQDLDWTRQRDFIVGRILVEGTWEQIRWLRARVGARGIRAWIMAHRGRGLSRQQIRFWELLLDLPHRSVNAWLRNPARAIWDNRVRV